MTEWGWRRGWGVAAGEVWARLEGASTSEGSGKGGSSAGEARAPATAPGHPCAKGPLSRARGREAAAKFAYRLDAANGGGWCYFRGGVRLRPSGVCRDVRGERGADGVLPLPDKTRDRSRGGAGGWRGSCSAQKRARIDARWPGGERGGFGGAMAMFAAVVRCGWGFRHEVGHWGRRRTFWRNGEASGGYKTPGLWTCGPKIVGRTFAASDPGSARLSTIVAVVQRGRA